MKNKLPSYIKSILTALNQSGFEAYVVGGAVRDFLLDRPVSDYDVTTNALPEEVKAIFKNKNREYSEFLLKLIKRIRENGNSFFISNEKIHKIINRFDQIGKLKNEDMHKSFDKIWKEYDLSENFECEKLIRLLNRFYRNLDSSQHIRKNKICNAAVKIDNHRFKDQKVKRIIEKENLREILHDKDEDILFDAHEYAKHHPELDLCFVSWDDDFIKAVKILLSQLSFKKYIGRYESNIE